MRESGLGTPATRAGIIETLLTRGYIERKGKAMEATQLGVQLIEIVHPTVKSPELTARWEKALSEIESGSRTFHDFIQSLQESLVAQVQELFATPVRAKEISENNPVALRVLSCLQTHGAQAAGRLFEEVAEELKGIHRREFEQVIESLEAVKKIRIIKQKFEKDGKEITFRKVCLVDRPNPSPISS